MIAATHGKRAIDNLTQFKPFLMEHQMDPEVQAFEESILFFADAYNKHGPGSRKNSPLSSGAATPPLSSGATSSTSTTPSDSERRLSGPLYPPGRRRSSFARRVSNSLALLAAQNAIYEDVFAEEAEDWKDSLRRQHQFEAWQIEAAAVDRSVRILPGVKRIMDSIPKGRYAVATSGAKTYGQFDTSQYRRISQD